MDLSHAQLLIAPDTNTVGLVLDVTAGNLRPIKMIVENAILQI
jgi:hypothetical protein